MTGNDSVDWPGHAAGGAGSARNGHTTALFTDECQSFLDNVIASLVQIGAWNSWIYEFAMDTFDILGRWEIDRGPQNLHYDFWWNLPRDYMVTSEWGLPPQFENGIVPEDLLGNRYGHQIHFWDLSWSAPLSVDSVMLRF